MNHIVSLSRLLKIFFRKSYSRNRDIVKEQSIITFFLDNCHESADFQPAAKRCYKCYARRMLTFNGV